MDISRDIRDKKKPPTGKEFKQLVVYKETHRKE
jgi:hypothetical protein